MWLFLPEGAKNEDTVMREVVGDVQGPAVLYTSLHKEDDTPLDEFIFFYNGVQCGYCIQESEYYVRYFYMDPDQDISVFKGTIPDSLFDKISKDRN